MVGWGQPCELPAASTKPLESLPAAPPPHPHRWHQLAPGSADTVTTCHSLELRSVDSHPLAPNKARRYSTTATALSRVGLPSHEPPACRSGTSTGPRRYRGSSSLVSRRTSRGRRGSCACIPGIRPRSTTRQTWQEYELTS